MKVAVVFVAFVVVGLVLALLQASSLQSQYASYYPLSAAYGSADIVLKLAIVTAIMVGLFAAILALIAVSASFRARRPSLSKLDAVQRDPSEEEKIAADAPSGRRGDEGRLMMVLSYAPACLAIILGALGGLYSYSSTKTAMAATGTTSLEVVAPSYIESLMGVAYGFGAALPAAILILIAAVRLRGLGRLNAQIERSPTFT